MQILKIFHFRNHHPVDIVTDDKRIYYTDWNTEGLHYLDKTRPEVIHTLQLNRGTLFGLVLISTGKQFLSLSQTSPGFYVSAVNVFCKTLWEKEKLLVMSNFSFSHSFFYPAMLSKFQIVVCKLFQFGRF